MGDYVQHLCEVVALAVDWKVTRHKARRMLHGRSVASASVVPLPGCVLVFIPNTLKKLGTSRQEM